MRRVYRVLSRPHTNYHRSRLVSWLVPKTLDLPLHTYNSLFSFDSRWNPDHAYLIYTALTIASAVYLTPGASERRQTRTTRSSAAPGHNTTTRAQLDRLEGHAQPPPPPPPSRLQSWRTQECPRATHCLGLRLGLGHTKHKHPVHVGGATQGTTSGCQQRDRRSGAARRASVRFRFLAP
jgi:hypothetical protein